MPRVLIVAIVMLALAAPRAAAEPSPTPAPEPTVLESRPDRLIVTLPNRLIVVAQRVPAAPVVSAQVWVKTGSVYEQEHVGAGLSHFLEHLVSGGTTSSRPEIQSTATLGAIGGQTNASTSLDNVRYYINTTADHAPQAIELLSDWLQHNVVLQGEYERERSVIQREFAMGQADPNRIFWKLTQLARYQVHPAKHPTIGYLPEFLEISRDEIYDFYKRMYVPNNMVFVVAGDIEPRKVVDQITELWKDSQPGELPELSFPVETLRAEPVLTEGYADIKRPRLRLAFPNVQLGEPGDYELDLLGVILGQGESSRLVRELRDKQGIVTSIEAYNYSATWGEAFFGVDAEVENGYDVEKIKAAVLDQLAKVRDEPVTEAELARAKRMTLANVLKGNQSAEAIAGRLAGDIIGTGDPDYLVKYAHKVQSITAEQLQAAAKRFLDPNKLVEVRLLPLKEGQTITDLERLPEEAHGDVARKPFELDNTRVIAELEEHLKGDRESQMITVEPVQSFTLDNGLRVLVQRSTVVPAVAVQMYTLGGLLADAPGNEGVANAVAEMQTRGTTSRTAAQIAEAVEDLGASLSSGSGNNTSFIHGSALSEDFPAMLDLFADVALNPSFPEDEWASMRPRILAAIDRETDSIWGEIRTHFREAYYGSYPWSQTTTGRREVVEKLTAADLRAFFTSHLSAEDSIIAVVGDIDPQAVRDEIAKRFGSMPAKAEQPFDPPMPGDPNPRVLIESIGKPGTGVALGFGPGVKRDHPDYPELAVLSRVISDFPAGWLEQELRGRGPGLVYGVGANVMTGMAPGYFYILFNTQADAAPEAIRRTMAAVARARAGQFTEEDLTRAKAKVLTGEFMGKQTNADRAADAALDKLYGLNDPGNAKFLAEVQAMTAEDLKRVSEKYLGEPVVVVVSGDAIEKNAIEAAVSGEAALAPTTPAR